MSLKFIIFFYAVAGWWYQVRVGEGGKGHVCGKGLAAVLVAGMEEGGKGHVSDKSLLYL